MLMRILTEKSLSLMVSKKVLKRFPKKKSPLFCIFELTEQFSTCGEFFLIIALKMTKL